MSVVVIRIDGVDVTANVMFADARFGSQVNGQPGAAELRVRDKDHIYTFRAGNTLTLDVDGVRVWGGWAMEAKRVYGFKVDDTTDVSSTERLWTISGVDYNLLFSKRFLINKANPTKQIPNSPAGTPDSVVILDAVANYLDLSGDGISTSGVEHVGSPWPDKVGNVGNPGASWGAAMNLICRPIGSIFYITPQKVLTYTDVDTANAPYALSDTPSGAEIGYADMEILRDGTKLANDAFVWGAGTGSTSGVTFARTEDAASIAAHGRWQVGEFTQNLYLQTSVTLRSSTMVYGSPQNKRGGKDDAISVTCTVFQAGFVAGQKVSFRSDVFGYIDVLPIRRMMITFPTPTDVQYQMTLSHDVDAAWSGYEFWFPRIDFHMPIIDIGTGGGGGGLPPPSGPGGCECGITDTFTRTVASGWGTSDSGLVWNEVLGPLSVNGTAGVMTAAASTSAVGRLEASYASNFMALFKFRTNFVGSGGDLPAIKVRLTNASFAGYQVIVDLSSTFGSGGLEIGAGWFDKTDWAINTWYNLRWHIKQGVTQEVKVWLDGDPEPAAYQLSVAAGSTDCTRFDIEANADNTEIVCQFDDLDITGVNRCTEYRFDNFNRTVASGWGTSNFGSAWTKIGGGGTLSVNGSSAVLFANDDYATMHAAQPSMPAGFVQTGRWSFSVMPSFNTNQALSLDVDPASGWAVRVQDHDAGLGRNGYISTSGGGTSPQIDVAIPDGFWAANRWYLWEWTLTPGVLNQFAIWPENNLGAKITVHQVTPTSTVPTTCAQFDLTYSRTSGSIYIDYIDFDYAGKPCYQDCGGQLLVDADEFNRTVAAGSTLGTSEFDAAQAWTWTGFGPPPTVVSVDGAVARATSSATDGGISNKIDPFDMRLPIDLVFKFKYHSALASSQIQYRWRLQQRTGGTAFAEVSLNAPQPGFGGGSIFIGGSAGTFSGTTINNGQGGVVFAEDTWLVIRASFRDNVFYVRMWHDVDPEPSSWAGNWTPPATLTSLLDLNNKLDLVAGGSNLGTGSEHYIDYIRFYDSCSNVPPAAGTSAIPEGSICEVGHRIDSTHYQTSYAITPGTTRIYIDGTLQRPGIARDYTVSDETGVVTFNDVVAVGEIVTICYNTNGAL